MQATAFISLPVILFTSMKASIVYDTSCGISWHRPLRRNHFIGWFFMASFQTRV